MLSPAVDQGPPPEGNLDHHRCIVHFDIDCFYAQARKQKGERKNAETTLTMRKTWYSNTSLDEGRECF